MQMIFDIQSSGFAGPPNQASNISQQTLRALITGNHQLFYKMLITHNTIHFQTPAFKILAECLDISESQAKRMYTKVFNEQIAEVIRGSEKDGRFFVTSEQRMLHKYIKYQYFGQKGRVVADKLVIQAYLNIFKRISNIDDFVFFIDFIVAPAIRQPFEYVEEKTRQFLSGQSQFQNDLEIFKLLETGSLEEKLIIQSCFCVVASNSSKKYESSLMDKITGQVQMRLKNEPLKQLLAACLQLCPMNIMEDVFEKHPRELIQFNFKNNQCRLNSQYLHPDLCGHSTFKAYFKKMNDLGQIVQKFQIIAHSARVEEGKLLLGINYELLGDDELIGDSKTMFRVSKKVTSKCISEFCDFLNLISTNISSEFVAIGEQQHDDRYYNVKYACKCFKAFATISRLKSIRQHHNLYQHILVTWGRLFLKWVQIKEIAGQHFFNKAIQSYFSVIYSVQKQQEYQPLTIFQSELSKVLCELLFKLEKYPLDLHCFKGIKTVIFNWAMQNVPETVQLKSILSKFINCFFDDNLVIKFHFKDDLFQTAAICRTIRKTISTQIIQAVTAKVQKLENSKINASWNSQAFQHSSFFFKLGYIISSRLLDSFDVFSQQLIKLYTNYAHVWPILHSYRHWILNTYKGHFDFKFEQKLQRLTQLFPKLHEKLQRTASSNTILYSEIQFVDQFYIQANVFINSLYLKKIREPISKQFVSKYVCFLMDMTQKIKKLFANTNKDYLIYQWANQGYSLERKLIIIQQELVLNLRFWITNSLRYVTVSQEQSIIKSLGEEIVKLAVNDVKQPQPWQFICTTLGINEPQYINSALLARQATGSSQRHAVKMSLRLQNFVFFSFASALYGSIRSNYKVVLKSIFNLLLQNQQKLQFLWLILEKILFTPVMIGGSCVFNGQQVERTREDMALGIYYEQFQKLTELLTEAPQMAENTKIIVMLQRKKFLSKFYEILISKNAKIMEKTSRHPSQSRYRGRNMSSEQVINNLTQMEISRQQAQIALQHIDFPDHHVAMQWLQNNQQRVDQLILARTLERTRQQVSRQPKKQTQVLPNQIVPLSFQKFHQKEKMIKLSRCWIKIIFKELFKEQNMESSQTLKDLLFMFMDSLKPDQVQNQYSNLNDKIYNQIDQLNKHEKISNRLLLYLTILEGSFSKTEKTKNDFFLKSINLKILSYLSRIQDPVIIEKIFSLINSTLPVFTINDLIIPQLQNYLCYVLDLILKYRNSNKIFSEIMLKIAKSGKQSLMRRITRNLKVFFGQNLIKQNAFALLNMLFETDKELTRVNAQLDLKTFLYERYQSRFAHFHPQKEHVLEIDAKQFQSSFPKYQKGSAIYQVSVGLLSKKKSKSRYFFYDCRKQKNAFHYSHYGNCVFLKYPLKEHFKTIIRSVLASLFEAKSIQIQEQIMTNLYKLLYTYRILVPFTIHQKILGKNLVHWLLFSQSNSKTKFKFLTFLTLNANLFIHKEGYKFQSLTDYIIAKIITQIMHSEQSNATWTTFAVLYLSQIRRFSELCQAYASEDVKMNLIQYYQQQIELERAQPQAYINITQFLYIQYKKRIVQNLSKKYRLASSHLDGAFDKQFLNLSPYFNSLAIKQENPNEQQVEDNLIDNAELDEDDDQQSPQMMFGQEQRNRYLRRRTHLTNHQSQYQELIIPMQQPASEQGLNKQKANQVGKHIQQNLEPIIIKNCQCHYDILEKFEKYLQFDEQVAIELDLKQVALPLQPVILTNLSNGFKLKVEEANVDLELRVRKLNGFQKRISQIYAVLAPNKSWEVPKKSEDRTQFVSLGRRLLQNLQNDELGITSNRQAFQTLERLMQARYNRQGSENPSRNLNINQIYQQLQQFTDPIVPRVQQPIRQPERPIQFPQLQAQRIQLISDTVQQVDSDNVNEIEIQAAQDADSPQYAGQLAMPQDFQYEQFIPGINQPPGQQADIIQAQLNIPQNSLQGEGVSNSVMEAEANLQNNFIPFRELESQGNNLAQQQAIQQIQQPNNQQIPEQVQQPQIREREILRMMGLPQTFLREIGLDEEFFDSLPQDLQQQQLIQFMSQQGVNINHPNSPNRNNLNPAPADQTSQNVIFLESLDPQTRVQVLLEATPDFLASLPPNIREEAQRHRRRQISRIIQQDDIEDERFHHRGLKNKYPQVYPAVKKEQFSTIRDATAQAIFSGAFNIYPKIKLSALKVLLQNKSTQEKTLATIIAVLNYSEFHQKYLKGGKMPENEQNWKRQKSQTFMNWSTEHLIHIRTYLLHMILEYIKIPLYKDEQFLMQKIKNQVYFKEIAPFFIAEEIDPLAELAGYSLLYHHQLAVEILKKTKDLPDRSFQRLVEGMRKQIWPLSLYDSLQNFSQNQTLKTIFAKQFENKPPSNKILSKLLKYKFAQLISLKQIHKDALEYYTPASIEFLNQIFCIYSVQDLNEIENLLIKYKQIHFEVIKNLIQNGREISKEPISIILKKPHLVDFETKKLIFRNHPSLRKSSRRVHIEVDRAYLFQGSYNQLMSRSVREIQGRIQVSFLNEPGYDAGGLKRQWFLLVSREIFNQNYALFEKSSSGSTYQPNPKSYINPDHLNYFKFIGRFIAKALVQRELIDAYFTRAFYKTIIGQQLQFNDLQAQDYEFYKSMQWLKNNKIDQGIFTFSYIYDNFGNKVEKELIPGGKDIIVNQENKKDYIEKYSMAKMRDDFSAQLKKFLEGFYQVIPQECISYFQAKELELLISGVPEVDIEDMKRNTDYSGYNPSDQIIIWFWEIVAQYPQQDVAKLVQFITGTSKIPVEGFSHLIGMNGIQRISIHRDPCEHQLPKSHTCFNQLDLPNYKSKQILREKLAICLTWGSEGFGFM